MRDQWIKRLPPGAVPSSIYFDPDRFGDIGYVCTLVGYGIDGEDVPVYEITPSKGTK